jgi:predicted nucleic acid-binding protein
MNVATDTCIVVNLFHVDRLDLLSLLPPYVFYIPYEVLEEIEEPEQRKALEDAIERGWLRQTRLDDPRELEIYARATERLGNGESACIALAEARGWILATDDSKGTRWNNTISAAGIEILNTPGIIILAIRAHLLTVEQADKMKTTLQQHRFKMSFDSFREFVSET